MEAFQRLLHGGPVLSAYRVAVEQGLHRSGMICISEPIGIRAAASLAVGAPVLQGVQDLVLHVPVRGRGILVLQPQGDDHIVPGLHASHHVVDVRGAEGADHLLLCVEHHAPAIVSIEGLRMDRQRHGKGRQTGQQPRPDFLVLHAFHPPIPPGSRCRLRPRRSVCPRRSIQRPRHCAPARRPPLPPPGKTRRHSRRW